MTTTSELTFRQSPGCPILKFNTQPVWLEAKFKWQIYGNNYIYILDRPLRLCYMSQFWYGWGEQVFDIREFRKAVRLKEVYAFDKSDCPIFKIANQIIKASLKFDIAKILEPLLYDLSFDKHGVEILTQNQK